MPVIGPSLHSAALDYIEAQRAKHAPENSLRMIRSVLMRLCKMYPRRKFAGITTRDLALFLDGPRGITLGKGPSVGKGARAILKRFFNYGYHTAGWSKKETKVPEPSIPDRRPLGRRE